MTKSPASSRTIKLVVIIVITQSPFQWVLVCVKYGDYAKENVYMYMYMYRCI